MPFNCKHLCSLCCFALAMTGARAADSFLQKEETASLLMDLNFIFGAEALQKRVHHMEARMGTLFEALPKTQSGLVPHSYSRYAVNRILTSLYGWRLPGLVANETTLNATSLVGSGILRGMMPVHIEHIFEQHIHSDGFNLNALAIIAATLEQLVHEDQKAVLAEAAEYLDIPTSGPISEEQLELIVKLYKVSFIMNDGQTQAERTGIARDHKRLQNGFQRTYPGWLDTALFLSDERQTLAFIERRASNPFKAVESSFQVAQRVVERAAGNFARKSFNGVCAEVTDDLLAYERSDTGRIRLADFYRAGLNSSYFYIENKDYLRALGALDESDRIVGDKVIVANYVQGRSICLAHGPVYSACCVSACDDLYDKLENSIRRHEGDVGKVLSLISKMPTATVHAPRNLSQTLMQRLDEIASQHGGKVPLHGRLFAQWMHQAFPRECPYPHKIGTVTSLSPAQWEKQHNKSGDAIPCYDAEEATLRVIEELEAQNLNGHGDTLPMADEVDLAWTTTEEIFAPPNRTVLQLVCSNLQLPLLLAVFWLLVLVLTRSSRLTSDKAQSHTKSSLIV